MRKMMLRHIAFFPVILFSLAFCGCKTLLQPSDRTRYSAYTARKSAFHGDEKAAIRQTYFVFSYDQTAEPPIYDPKTRKIKTPEGTGEFFSQGLAVGIGHDGYLITAGHVLGKYNYVFGWLDDQLQLKPCRIIVCENDPDSDLDFALIKVEGTIEKPVGISAAPKANDPVFAVVCYREKGRRLGLTAGSVLDIQPPASGEAIHLINTDLPLWRGDSGGPVLSDSGELIGITTGGHYRWRITGYSFKKLCFLPEKDFVHDLVAQDRASGQDSRQQNRPEPDNALEAGRSSAMAGALAGE